MDGKYKNVETDLNDWQFHKNDDSVDVAVLQFTGLDNFDAFTIPSERYALSNQIIKENYIGVGDEVFIAGLFRCHYGKQRNLPIIRHGEH